MGIHMGKGEYIHVLDELQETEASLLPKGEVPVISALPYL